jgi:hypothetical protein
VSLLLRYFKRIRRRRRRKISVRGLNGRRRLPIKGKRWK